MQRALEPADAAAERAEAGGNSRGGESSFYLSILFQLGHRPFGTASVPAMAAAVPVPPRSRMCRLCADLAGLAYNIEELDGLTGVVLEALNRSGLFEDTSVVVTTEHGSATARAKHALSDAGIKIALLVRWPSRVSARARRDELPGNVNLLRTVI